jgi:hypoxanthine phosphoribosyltransferase
MEFECYTIQEFEKDVEIIVRLIKERGLRFRNVYGPPRGGLVLGVYLSYRLNIPLLLDAEKVSRETLIVDDIADTGRTLAAFAQRRKFIVTLFYHRQCWFEPDIWLREKKDAYVIFPWEDAEKEKKKARKSVF